jgi:NADPH:quinone reductase-like Zn-dependent oxidoreductase
MRAMTYAQYGDTDVLELTDQPTPKVGPGELLVEVRAASVNPVDWKLMSGGLDGLLDVRFPVVPGWDVAGVVVQVGIDNPEFSVGDEVVAYNRQDYVHRGTFAELTTVPVRAAARKPRDVSWEEAASLPLAGLTALRILDQLEVGPEDTVLVHGAGGGVGSFAVQLAARAFRARVIASASAGQHDRLRDLGAEPVEYGDGLVDAVRELAPDGVSVVVDLVGGVLEQTQAVLEDDGRHASIADGEVTGEGGSWIWVRPDGEALGRLVGLVEDGAVRIEVEDVYDLEDLAKAFARSQEGHVHGKLAVRVSED